MQLMCTGVVAAVVEREEERRRPLRLQLQLQQRHKMKDRMDREWAKVVAIRHRYHDLYLDLYHDRVPAPSPLRVNFASPASLYCSLSFPKMPMDLATIRCQQHQPEILRLLYHRRLLRHHRFGPWTFLAVRHRHLEDSTVVVCHQPLAVPARSSRTKNLRYRFLSFLLFSSQENLFSSRVDRHVKHKLFISFFNIP